MKTEYPTYLVHFNQNHSSSNGQFISGDGDGDGVVDDHAHRSKGLRKKIKDHYDKKYERAVKRYNTSPAERRQQLKEAKAEASEKIKSNKKKIGLGIGIGVGALAASAAIFAGATYANNAKELKGLSEDAKNKGFDWLSDLKPSDMKVSAMLTPGAMKRSRETTNKEMDDYNKKYAIKETEWYQKLYGVE